MTRRSGLGRGLGALIPTGTSTSSSSALRDVPLSQIRPNPFQPRKNFDEEALSALVDSIRAVGILQPVLLRKVGEEEYELIAGERRYRAARRAGFAALPALVSSADDVTSLEQALVENVHRADLNALEEAAAYQQLIEDFGLTHEDLGRRVGKSRAAVTNALRLFQLPPTVQRMIRDGLLSPGAARAILGTPDRVMQEEIAGEAVQGGLSVRAVEELVRERFRPPDEELPAPEPESLHWESVEAAPRAEAAPVLRPPGVLDLEELMGDHLNTRVRIDMGGKHGRVLIEFATLDDLERIYRVIIGDSSASGHRTEAEEQGF
ncbi:MAG: ParB/RepB/Spo0J family partition protein [Acidimicrobiales bacterium]